MRLAVVTACFSSLSDSMFLWNLLRRGNIKYMKESKEMYYGICKKLGPYNWFACGFFLKVYVNRRKLLPISTMLMPFQMLPWMEMGFVYSPIPIPNQDFHFTFLTSYQPCLYHVCVSQCIDWFDSRPQHAHSLRYLSYMADVILLYPKLW